MFEMVTPLTVCAVALARLSQTMAPVAALQSAYRVSVPAPPLTVPVPRDRIRSFETPPVTERFSMLAKETAPVWPLTPTVRSPVAVLSTALMSS